MSGVKVSVLVTKDFMKRITAAQKESVIQNKSEFVRLLLDAGLKVYQK